MCRRHYSKLWKKGLLKPYKSQVPTQRTVVRFIGSQLAMLKSRAKASGMNTSDLIRRITTAWLNEQIEVEHAAKIAARASAPEKTT